MRVEPDFYLCELVIVFGVQRTLLELLGVVSDRHGSVPIAICVSSRDELDAVCAAVANLPFVSLHRWYAQVGWVPTSMFSSLIYFAVASLTIVG